MPSICIDMEFSRNLRSLQRRVKDNAVFWRNCDIGIRVKKKGWRGVGSHLFFVRELPNQLW